MIRGDEVAACAGRVVTTARQILDKIPDRLTDV